MFCWRWLLLHNGRVVRVADRQLRPACPGKKYIARPNEWQLSALQRHWTMKQEFRSMIPHLKKTRKLILKCCAAKQV